MKLISIGKLLLKYLPSKRICGITLKAKNIRQNLKKVTDCLMKSKRVFLNICKQREDVSQDSSSCLMKNYFKF